MCDRKASYGCCSRSNVPSSCSSTPKKETATAPKKEECEHNVKASQVAPALTAHASSAPKTEVEEEEEAAAVSVVKQEESVKVNVGK
ncbi:hypothetical protein CICLE_v10002986mg [Citrus x clementina]|uniref:Uncharacterized protein n=3 Tax=Citrus TaxID=2706 RepID=A0A067GSR6_CITSI|nr:hypothetical protein CICLE_v10002986mg [Citrus x clementina]KDO81695.1 hypothetical protein CISIN_1g045698mg [Citrus sinensis]GAY54383.1 hypothetical protein CUMW_156300 [Citrus unshiu]